MNKSEMHFELLGYGQRILCQCDDEECYMAIEVGPGALHIHSDISDKYEDEVNVFNLPDGIELCRVKKGYTHEATLDWLADDVVAWAKRTFPWQTKEGVVAHLKREMRELADAPHDPEEMADVFLLLVQVAAHHNVDLALAVREKYHKNQGRNWGKPDDEGVSEHE